MTATLNQIFDRTLDVFARVRKPRVASLMVEQGPTVVTASFWNEDRTAQARIECRWSETGPLTTASVQGFSTDESDTLARFVRRVEGIKARIHKAAKTA